MRKTKFNKMLIIHGFILVTILATAKSAEAELTMEAAFQGHCGHTSPCEQLCYEIHDGMYECDCIEGYELNRNGYSCQVINSSSSSDGHSKSDEDVLYQKGASFSAKLANGNERDTNQLLASTSFGGLSSASASASSSASGSEEDTGDTDIFFDDELATRLTQQKLQKKEQQQKQKQEKQQVNSKDYDISVEGINFDSNNNNKNINKKENNNNNKNNDDDVDDYNQSDFNTNNYNDVPEFGVKLAVNSQQQQKQHQHDDQHPQPHPQSLQKVSTTIKTHKYRYNFGGHKKHQHHPRPEEVKKTSRFPTTNTNTTISTTSSQSTNTNTNTNSNIASKQLITKAIDINNNNLDNLQDDYYSQKDLSIYDDVNNNQLNLRPLNPRTYQNQKAYTFDSNSNSISVTNDNLDERKNNKYDGDIETTLPEGGGGGGGVTTTALSASRSENISTMKDNDEGRLKNYSSELCSLDCGIDGLCEGSDGQNSCLCPFGKTGISCVEDIKVRVPKFSKKSWLAFPALRGAYKHVQIRVEFRPESFDGVVLLSCERDDLTGDFMALLLNKGFVEFWFDCGSGAGSVRSKETILLNEWNSVIIYRHRWDAWLVLNHGTRVQGRSNGLFSRITFREPVFLGGIGNITGLAKRLPVAAGFVGCIRRFVANEHEYKFEEHPLGDVSKGFDIQDCVTDKCFKYPCQHGGKCLPSDQGAVCLCPIGFVGDLCEIRMDLQVPAFNGTSFLHYAPLGDSALIWLELKVILKPEQPDGIILYSGPKRDGDFIALSLNGGYVEFAFELGSGPAVVRSDHPLTIGQWHTIKVSRTARLAVLKIDDSSEVMTISSNGFWHLSLPHNLFLGGVNHMDSLPLDLKYRPYFVGCIQKIDINGHALSIVSEAIGGTNIGNCPHACVARPCGPLAQCIPQMESYECRCSAYNVQCNKAAELPLIEVPEKLKTESKAPGRKHGLEHPSDLRLEKTLNKKHNHKRTKSRLKKATHKSTEAPKLKTLESSDNEDDIIFRDVHSMHRSNPVRAEIIEASIQTANNAKIQRKSELTGSEKHSGKEHGHLHHGVKHDPHHKHAFMEQRKLSRLPTHYERFQTNPESDILTFEDIQEDTNFRKQDDGEEIAVENTWDWSAPDDYEHQVNLESHETDRDGPFSTMEEMIVFDGGDGGDEAHRKQLAQDMQRIMGNPHHERALKGTEEKKAQQDKRTDEGDVDSDHNNKMVDRIGDPNHSDHGDQDDLADLDVQQDHAHHVNGFADADHAPSDENVAGDGDRNNGDALLESVVENTDEKPNTQPHTDWSVLGRFDLTGVGRRPIGVKKNFGACFFGSDSYFHYDDAETMSKVISYNIDLNLRIKTHSRSGVILWTGRQSSSKDDDDFLSLGIENGYLHFRYDLGSGDVDIRFNGTIVSDGLWHRVRAIRNSQDGYLEVDGRKSPVQRSPGRLRQLNTDAGLFVGGMPDVSYFTRRKYTNGIVGCISEIVLAGELKLNFDPNTLGAAHNVETGIL